MYHQKIEMHIYEKMGQFKTSIPYLNSGQDLVTVFNVI